MLHHLTHYKPQIDSLSAPHLLTSLNTFLLSCKVDGLSLATIRNYSYQLNAFANFCYTKQFREITSQEIRLFLADLQKSNNPVSVSDYYKVLKRFFNWLVQEGVIKQSPMGNVKSPKLPSLLPKPFSPHDIENLLLITNEQTFLGYRNRAMILLFLDTGLRLAELTNIQLADIDFDRETIKVMGKGAKERVVRIGKSAQKALLRYLLSRDDGYPCLWVTEERRPMTKDGIQSCIKVLCRRAEITDAKIGPHTFRHTFATLAIKNGANLFYVQSLLGHSTLTMTRRYASTIDSEEAVKEHHKFSPVDNLRLK